MAFQTIATYYFDKKFKKLTKKDGLLKERVVRKLQKISINPEIGEPKSRAIDKRILIFKFSFNAFKIRTSPQSV